tara:strand:+ start:507 stop:800 length:294 start_codon:yes stop_codon:yes gene_type:complete
MAFDYFLEVFLLNFLTIDFRASFLNNNRLPHLGQVDRKDMYSVILDRFQLCEQVKHFINISKLSERQDLNLRPRAPHARALPGCATLRIFNFVNHQV